ncbi:MAG: hypothetical protein QXQ77_02435 [Candidatus Aenigmatarchaeota archaeon]
METKRKIVGVRFLLEQEAYEKLKQKVKERGYFNLTDYFREKVREILNG